MKNKTLRIIFLITAMALIFSLFAGCAKDITVTYDLNYENSTAIEQTYQKGATVTLPTAPTRDGYAFGGWFNSSACTEGDTFDISVGVSENKTVYAKWTAVVVYTITYNLNYDDEVLTTQQYQEGATVTLPTAPTREGYTFGGWYNTAECALTGAYNVAEGVSADKTVYAKWTLIPVYSLTYDLNYDDEILTTQEYKRGETVTLPTAPTREGYTFGGWYTNVRCADNRAFVATDPMTSTKTVYAKWLPDLKVTFVLKYTDQERQEPIMVKTGGKVSAPIMVQTGGQIPAPTTAPTRTGYTFGGWYADADSTVPFDFENTVITENTRIWAKWTKDVANSAAYEQAAFELWLDELFVNEFTGGSTINLHYTIKDPAKYGLDGQEVSIGSATVDDSGEGDLGLIDLYCEFFDFDLTLLTADQSLEYRSLKMYIETLLMSEGLDYVSGYCDSISGVQNNMPINLAEYKFYSEQDVIDYLELLTQLPRYFEEIIEFETKRVELGMGYVDSKLEEAISQCEDFLEDKETNYLISTFNTRIENLNEALDAEDKMTAQKIADYKATNVVNFNSYVVTAYEYLAEELANFLGKAEVNGGMAMLEGGKDYYEFLVKYYTGTDKDMDEIIDWLEEYVIATCDAALDDVPTTNLGFNFESSPSDPTVQAKSILNYIIDEIMPGLFPVLEDEVYTNYTINFVHEALEDALSPAFYMIPAIDNYMENTIYLNRGSVDASDLLGNYTTLGHEGFPGHLYQTAYYYSNVGRILESEETEKRWHEARILVSCTGYVEGWTSYIEKVLYEQHIFPSSTATGENTRNEEITQLLIDTDIFYMVFISRIDMGINYEGWSSRDVYSYFEDTFNFSNTAYCDNVIDFVIGAPANYLKYTLGMLEFLELRDWAMEQLGDEFTLIGFHQALLDVGECQMIFVKESVEAWVASVLAD